eukprot:122974-Pyramimonas_sp.AAC.1
MPARPFACQYAKGIHVAVLRHAPDGAARALAHRVGHGGDADSTVVALIRPVVAVQEPGRQEAYRPT